MGNLKTKIGYLPELPVDSTHTLPVDIRGENGAANIITPEFKTPLIYTDSSLEVVFQLTPTCVHFELVRDPKFN